MSVLQGLLSLSIAVSTRYWNKKYLLEVEIILRPQQMELLLLILGGTHQQIVEHVVIPEGHNAQ